MPLCGWLAAGEPFYQDRFKLTDQRCDHVTRAHAGVETHFASLAACSMSAVNFVAKDAGHIIRLPASTNWAFAVMLALSPTRYALPAVVELCESRSKTILTAHCLYCYGKCEHESRTVVDSKDIIPEVWADFALKYKAALAADYQFCPGAAPLHHSSGHQGGLGISRIRSEDEMRRCRVRELEPRVVSRVVPYTGRPDCKCACGKDWAVAGVLRDTGRRVTYLGACSVSLNVPVFDLFCPVCKEAKDYCDAEDFTLQTNGYITELELCRNMVLQSQHAHALFNQQHKVMVDAYLDRAVVALDQAHASSFPSADRVSKIFYQFMRQLVIAAGDDYGAWKCPRCKENPKLLIDATMACLPIELANIVDDNVTGAPGTGICMVGSLGIEYTMNVPSVLRALLLRGGGAPVASGKPARATLTAADDAELLAGLRENDHLCAMANFVEYLKQLDPARANAVHRGMLCDMGSQSPSMIIATGGANQERLQALFRRMGVGLTLSLSEVDELKKGCPLFGGLIDWVGVAVGDVGDRGISINPNIGGYMTYLADHAATYWQTIDARGEILPPPTVPREVIRDMERGTVTAPFLREKLRDLSHIHWRQDCVGGSKDSVDRHANEEHVLGASCHRATMVPPSQSCGVRVFFLMNIHCMGTYDRPACLTPFLWLASFPGGYGPMRARRALLFQILAQEGVAKDFF